MEQKNFGLIFEPLAPEDWQFGQSKLGLEVRRPDANWTVFLPTGEKQKRQDEDKMCCVTASALNTIETEFIYQIKNELVALDDLLWLREKGYLDENYLPDFSDRFIALLSNTSRSGNSPKRVADAIRKFGLIPEKLLPYRKSMTWDEFYNWNDVTQQLKDLGQEFKQRFPINYEFVSGGKPDYDLARKYNPLQVFVYAWNGMDNGEYVRVEYSANHAVENNKENQIFDTYEPYLKNLATNFKYMDYGTRFIISFKKKLNEDDSANQPQEENKLMKCYQNLNTPDLYFQGEGDGLFHWVPDMAMANAIWAEDAIIHRLPMVIPPDKIGKTYYPKDNLLTQILNLFLKLKGKKK